MWERGDDGEAEQLASCYRHVLMVAADIGSRSIGIPAISTGIYGYPPDQAAVIAITTLINAYAPSIDEVVLVAFDPETEQRYEHILATGV